MRRRARKLLLLLLAAALSVLACVCIAGCDSGVADAGYVLDVVNGEHPDVTIVDVRTQSEYDEGHIPGAVNIIYSVSPCSASQAADNMAAQYKEAGFDEQSQLVLYCKTGVRAANAAETLEAAGFEHIKVYEGSWTDWTSDPDNPIE